jgi:hypothetical protein
MARRFNVPQSLDIFAAKKHTTMGQKGCEFIKSFLQYHCCVMVLKYKYFRKTTTKQKLL